jgi:hypothetical protein
MATKRKETVVAVREPYQRKRDPNAEAKEKILVAVRIGTTISGACLGAGVPNSTLYYWLDNDPIFSDDFIAARAAGRNKRAAYYEDLLLARAQEGSDACIIFALKSLSPEQYRERKELFTAPVPKVYEDRVMDEV